MFHFSNPLNQYMFVLLFVYVNNKQHNLSHPPSTWRLSIMVEAIGDHMKNMQALNGNWTTESLFATTTTTPHIQVSPTTWLIWVTMCHLGGEGGCRVRQTYHHTLCTTTPIATTTTTNNGKLCLNYNLMELMLIKMKWGILFQISRWNQTTSYTSMRYTFIMWTLMERLLISKSISPCCCWVCFLTNLHIHFPGKFIPLDDNRHQMRKLLYKH